MPRDLLSFSFEGGGIGGSPASWANKLSGQPIYLLAAHPAEGGRDSSRRPLFGIVAADVASVKAAYADGSMSARADSRGGGFILALGPSRAVKKVVAYGSDFQRIDAVDPGPFAGR